MQLVIFSLYLILHARIKYLMGQGVKTLGKELNKATPPGFSLTLKPGEDSEAHKHA